MAALGEHFLDTNKNWGLASGKSVPLVDLAYAQNPYSGFDYLTAINRTYNNCVLLQGFGCTPMPYLRADFAPGQTLSDDPLYYRMIVDICRSWARPETLTIICGNEPNSQQEGQLMPEYVATVVSKVATLVQILGYSVRVFAPAIGPWAPANVSTPDDFFPGTSRMDKNHQYGLARNLASVPIHGYALHAYGRLTDQFGVLEPLTDYTDSYGCQWGFRWWREALEAINAGDPRGLPLAVTETNTHTDNPSSITYVSGWLQNAVADLSTEPRIESASWFVGDSCGVWIDDSLKQRTGNCAMADDDLNSIISK